MELSTAIALLKKGVTTSPAQVWADFGAGTGLFTKALSTLLPKRSSIYAIDRDSKALHGIVIPAPDVSLKKIAMDFVNNPIELEPLDGIVMANSLHFVDDKFEFIVRIKQSLKESGRILIIEYDRETANTWVPYPISYQSLERLAQDVGAATIESIGSTPSKYDEANIYSAMLSFQ